MSKSGSHGVDVDARTEQMRGRRVANGVRADSLHRERGYEVLGSRGGALDQRVNAEARGRLATPVEEDVLEMVLGDKPRSRCMCLANSSIRSVPAPGFAGGN